MTSAKKGVRKVQFFSLVKSSSSTGEVLLLTRENARTRRDDTPNVDMILNLHMKIFLVEGCGKVSIMDNEVRWPLLAIEVVKRRKTYDKQHFC